MPHLPSDLKSDGLDCSASNGIIDIALGFYCGDVLSPFQISGHLGFLDFCSLHAPRYQCIVHPNNNIPVDTYVHRWHILSSS